MTPYTTSTAVAIALAFSAVACTNKEPVEPPAPVAATPTTQSVILAPASLADTIERVIPTVVKVTCISTIKVPEPSKPANPPGKKTPEQKAPTPPEKPQRAEGYGTGLVYDRSAGHIITNEHVVSDCDAIKVSLHGEERRLLPATMVGKDKLTDVAVLKIAGNAAPAQAVLGNDNKLRLGDNVFAIGHPYQFYETVTRGILSGKGRSYPGSPYDNLLQTDVSINPGNSGGPLFNEMGEVVGINHSIHTSNGQFAGISFSIPITQAKWVADKLIEKGHVPWGYLDARIDDLTEERATKLGRADLKGVWIIALGESSPAKGIVKNDDIVLRVNGKEVNRAQDLARNVAETLEGNMVYLDVWRNNQPLSLAIRLAPRPTEKPLAQGILVPN